MQQLIQYFTALEARIAAQETRIATLEAQLANNSSDDHQVQEQIVTLETRIAELEARLASISSSSAASSGEDSEPEIEVELVFNEEPEDSSDEVTNSNEVNSSVEDTNSSNEVANSSAESTISSEPEAKPAGLASVSDLRKAISLGDRFLFVKELFGGEGEKLQIVIDELNKLNSLAEANDYLDRHFHWDKESKAYELFQNALTRRFA